MRISYSSRRKITRPNVNFGVNLGMAILLGAFAAGQDIKLNVTYLCNGERIYVENCNIRDLSDTSTCMVGHPDRPTRNGIMAYTTETRGALKKLFPTCKPPTPQELAAADAFKKKQQEIYDANVAKANPQAAAQVSAQPGSQVNGRGNAAAAQSAQGFARPAPPKNEEERAMRRCVSSGRLPATCTGNSLLGAFGQMVGQVLPGLNKEPAPGPEIAGVFQGAGNWRIDFIDNGVLVSCADLSPDQHSYTLEFRNNLAILTVDTTPRPLVLTVKADGTITGPGPVQIDGVIATGYDSGYRDQFGRPISATEAASSTTQVFDSNGHPVTTNGLPGHATFSKKRVTCPALNLSSKGAGVGIQTMQTDLLKNIFNDGEKGPPTPPGIRMHGIFAASTGFSAQFFPESVILGCGPDSARAYPYTVVADGTKMGIKVDAPDHPLMLAFGPNGSLNAGTGPYQVHGRMVVGQNDNGDFTFVPMEQTCNLAVLTPSKQIPSSGGTAATAVASAGASVGTPGTAAKGGGLSTPAAPLGNATLSIVSGFRPQPGAPNPLAGRPYILLRDSYANSLAKGGVAVPLGTSPYVYASAVCVGNGPDCQKTKDAINMAAASAVRADANGSGTFPGVPPGTYYLMISAPFNNQVLIWGQAVQLKAGTNSLTLDPSNATPLK